MQTVRSNGLTLTALKANVAVLNFACRQLPDVLMTAPVNDPYVEPKQV